ncbi:hypothetical protein CEXT_678061, partial [Caerostris extrusa]
MKDRRKGFTMTWRIENATFFWQRTLENISSPAHEDEVEDIEIDFELSFYWRQMALSSQHQVQSSESEYRFLYFELATQGQVKISTIQISIIDMLGDPIEGVNNVAVFNCPITRRDLEQIETIRYGNANLQTTLSSSHAAAEETPFDIISILKKNIRTLFGRGFASDVLLKTKTGPFPAHNSILGAHSPVFAAMFSSGMQESTCYRVDIRDLEDDTVQLMLQFMYTTGTDELDWGEGPSVVRSCRQICCSHSEEDGLDPLGNQPAVMQRLPSPTYRRPASGRRPQARRAGLHSGQFKEVTNSEECRVLVETSPKLVAGQCVTHLKI